MTDTVIEASRLCKSFGAKRVLDDLSFTVDTGDIIGVLGKNGAGKTTLLEIMLGFTPASTGTVRVFGHDSFRLPAAIKAQIGFVPQQDELINALDAANQLNLIASFYRNWDRDLIARLSDAWEVDPAARVKAMSVGQRQKLSILLALGHHPDLLVLDEPVASLDPIARRQFLEQIVDVAVDGDRAVVLSSHIVTDIERLANKIWILKDGRLHWAGEIDALKNTVVRLHLRSSDRLPDAFSIPDAISIRRENCCVTAVVCNWTVASLDLVRAAAGVEPEIEMLTLEDIFLELHK